MDAYSAKVHIANKLRALREKNGYTQKDIGRITGKAHTTVASWESAKSQPDVDTLLSLCMLYGVDDVLLEFDYKEAPAEVTREEKELLTVYRKLSMQSRNIVSDLVDGLIDLEESMTGSTLLAVARGDGKVSVFEPKVACDFDDLEDDEWKGEEK